MMVTPQMAVYEKLQHSWLTRAVITACELGLADHLASGPKTIRELAGQAHCDETYLYRVMRALAGEGIFKELPGRVFKNTRLSSTLREGPGSFKYLFLHQFSTISTDLLVRLSDSVRTGEDIAGKVLGKGGYQHLNDNPEKLEIYQKGMDQTSVMIAQVVLSAYDFKGIRTIVDAGGGRGLLLASILESYPDMHGILFDQPHVVANAEGILTTYGLKERLRITGGDLLIEVPRGADAYLMKNILHSFSDADCLKMLRNIHDAMAPNGKLLLLETIIKSDNKPSLGKLMDLLMMTGTHGGKERTREEFDELCRESDLKVSRVIRTVAPFSIIEVVRR